MEKRESMWDAYLRKGMSRRSFIKGCVALTSLMGLSTDMVSKVVEDRPALVPAGLELARVIAAKDPMAVRLTKEAMRANVDAAGFDNALQVENRNQTLMIAHNVNKDASQDPIGKYWIEDRVTDPMNPTGAN